MCTVVIDLFKSLSATQLIAGRGFRGGVVIIIVCVCVCVGPRRGEEVEVVTTMSAMVVEIQATAVGVAVVQVVVLSGRVFQLHMKECPTINREFAWWFCGMVSRCSYQAFQLVTSTGVALHCG